MSKNTKLQIKSFSELKYDIWLEKDKKLAYSANTITRSQIMINFAVILKIMLSGKKILISGCCLTDQSRTALLSHALILELNSPLLIKMKDSPTELVIYRKTYKENLP